MSKRYQERRAKIRQAVEDSPFSQREIAQYIGTHPAYLSHVLTGESVSAPKLNQVEKYLRDRGIEVNSRS